MVILYATDLIFTTRIRAEASAAGATMAVARGTSSLRGRLEALASAGGEGAKGLLIVDLDADDAVAAVQAAAGGDPRPRIVAFVSHVNAALARAARDAGADEVLARSAFVTRLPALLAEHAG